MLYLLLRCVDLELDSSRWLTLRLFMKVGGVANNFGCFFLSGLPGGLDYVLLVLVKEGYITKMDEKRWNSRINTWLRGPSMSVYAFIGWTAWYNGKTQHMPSIIVFIVVFLHFFNGQHYAEEAIGGYHKWKTKLELEQKNKKE
eukprot:m.205851 g.205851  ORF g.205851 m.205851 type:complete len:143 (+) comp15791_c0_seq13:556-984(+)